MLLALYSHVYRNSETQPQKLNVAAGCPAQCRLLAGRFNTGDTQAFEVYIIHLLPTTLSTPKLGTGIKNKNSLHYLVKHY